MRDFPRHIVAVKCNNILNALHTTIYVYTYISCLHLTFWCLLWSLVPQTNHRSKQSKINSCAHQTQIVPLNKTCYHSVCIYFNKQYFNTTMAYICEVSYLHLLHYYVLNEKNVYYTGTYILYSTLNIYILLSSPLYGVVRLQSIKHT